MKQKRQQDPSMPVVRLASHSRGRFRVKVGRGIHRGKLLAQIKDCLQAQPGVSDVNVNPATGSAVVTYDHSQHNKEEMLRVLSDLDVVVESISLSPREDADHAGLQPPGLVEAIDDLNAYLKQTLGVRLDLRMALPLGLLAIGAWSTARRGLMIESVPGWVFLWLAFDTFVKLHLHPGLLTPTPTPAPSPASPAGSGGDPALRQPS